MSVAWPEEDIDGGAAGGDIGDMGDIADGGISRPGTSSASISTIFILLRTSLRPMVAPTSLRGVGFGSESLWPGRGGVKNAAGTAAGWSTPRASRQAG